MHTPAEELAWILCERRARTVRGLRNTGRGEVGPRPRADERFSSLPNSVLAPQQFAISLGLEYLN